MLRPSLCSPFLSWLHSHSTPTRSVFRHISRMATVNAYHGPISREIAEQRIVAASARYVGQPLFLVRQSSKDPNKLVLSCCRGQPHLGLKVDIKHIVINILMGPHNNVVGYQLNSNTKAQPSFQTLDMLLTHYKSPASDSPAPIGTIVPAPQEPVQQQQFVPQQVVQQVVQPQPVVQQPAQVVEHVVHKVVHGHVVQETRQEVIQPPVIGEVVGAQLTAVPEPQERSALGGAHTHQTGVHLATQDELICEGYLSKIRGVGQTKKRWFRLTESKLMYMTKEAGEVIASCDHTDVAAVSDMDKTKIRVVTKESFGSGHHQELILDCGNARIKNKWINGFKRRENLSGGLREQGGLLIIEGPLLKVQPMGTVSKTRWFMLTDRHLAYYKDEASEMMAAVNLENITTIVPVDAKSFRVVANQRFTKTGAFELTCRCDSESVKNKWMGGLRRVLSPEKFPT